MLQPSKKLVPNISIIDFFILTIVLLFQLLFPYGSKYIQSYINSEKIGRFLKEKKQIILLEFIFKLVSHN